MCISAIVGGIMAAAPIAGAAAAVYGVTQARSARKEAAAAQQQAVTAAAKVDTTAAQTANARLAQRRRSLAANSLVTDQSSGMASTGRTTLGGG